MALDKHAICRPCTTRLDYHVSRVPYFAVGPAGRSRCRIRVWHDGGDEVADCLDLLLAAVRDEPAREDLRGEQRGPRDAHFGVGAGPFAAVEGFHRELDEDLIGGMGLPSVARSMRSHCAGDTRICLCREASGDFVMVWWCLPMEMWPLWEMRFSGRDGIARALYVTAKHRRVVVVRVYVKKTPRTPRREIEVALRRTGEVLE